MKFKVDLISNVSPGRVLPLGILGGDRNSFSYQKIPFNAPDH